MRLRGRVAIITGVANPRGVGRSIATLLAREGADLVLADTDGGEVERISREILSMDRRAIAARIDASEEEQVKSMVEAALAEFGRIDILVNSGGVVPPEPILEVTSEEWDRVLSINLKGPFLCTRAVLPTMIRQGHGRIVFVASMVGKCGAGPAMGAHYAASQAGVMGLAKTVARQVAAYGITANCVALGHVRSDSGPAWIPLETAGRPAPGMQAEQVPLGRLGTPGDVAEAVLFLASDAASYITGEVLDVNGGLHID